MYKFYKELFSHFNIKTVKRVPVQDQSWVYNIPVRRVLSDEDEAYREMLVHDGFSHSKEVELMDELYKRGVTPDEYELHYGLRYAQGESKTEEEWDYQNEYEPDGPLADNGMPMPPEEA